jgi:hypothetical protein
MEPRPYDLTEDMDDDYYINAPGRRKLIAAGRSDIRDGEEIPLWPPQQEMDRGEEPEPRQENEGTIRKCLRKFCTRKHPHSEGGARNRRTKKRRRNRKRR